ncbi:uncharacterized protein LOC110683854 [Chenopodium quinoa]|uniref:uncharacterized protein LOC110683854 n=1 Tax=Chenopodium quinoa TaxID=63459 RepID=UPI000B780B3C|nr:uncharacterized protein LOC110683854 [Chenopodium quinoa]
MVMIDDYPDFKSLIEAWGGVDVKTQQRGAVLLWLIWERYNKKIYGCKLPKSPKSSRIWQPPSQECIKINCDAALNVEGWIGLGAVARNHLGEVLFAGVRRYKAHWSPQLAECKAAVYAVKLAKQHGLKNVILESDNSTIISRLTKASTYLSDLDSLLDDVLDACFYFDFISWSHVKREGNFVAHHLARVIPYDVEQQWSNCCPSDISPYVLMDKLSSVE